MEESQRKEVVEFTEKTLGKKVINIKLLFSLSNFVCLIETETQSVIVRKWRDISPFTFFFRSIFRKENFISANVLFEEDGFQIEKYIQNIPVNPKEAMIRNNCMLFMRPLAEYNSLGCRKGGGFFVSRLIEQKKEELLSIIRTNLDTLTDIKLKENLECCLEFVLETVSTLRPNSDENVLCHNDFWYSNVLFDTDCNRFKLIDFEYSEYNPKGYDIASYLNECLIEYDLPTAPYFKLKDNLNFDEKMAREMVKFYIFFSENKNLITNLSDDCELLTYIQSLKQFINIENVKIDQIFNQFNTFFVAINCFWFLWGLFYFTPVGNKLSFTDFAFAKFSILKFYLSKNT